MESGASSIEGWGGHLRTGGPLPQPNMRRCSVVGKLSDIGLKRRLQAGSPAPLFWVLPLGFVAPLGTLPICLPPGDSPGAVVSFPALDVAGEPRLDRSRSGRPTGGATGPSNSFVRFRFLGRFWFFSRPDSRGSSPTDGRRLSLPRNGGTSWLVSHLLCGLLSVEADPCVLFRHIHTCAVVLRHDLGFRQSGVAFTNRPGWPWGGRAYPCVDERVGRRPCGSR